MPQNNERESIQDNMRMCVAPKSSIVRELCRWETDSMGISRGQRSPNRNILKTEHSATPKRVELTSLITCKKVTGGWVGREVYS